jgi:D-inositol-3-phosphate glycosyltransferase
LNRLTLTMQYRLADHLFVHTELMKDELERDFGVEPSAITVIPFGLNQSARQSDLTPTEAKARLGLDRDERVLLFFGHIGPYKGLDVLAAAFHRLAARDARYRLLVSGRPAQGYERPLAAIRALFRSAGRDRVRERLEFVSDEETEIYFKAADVLILPYTAVYQSGVLILGYAFGLPCIAADVGSFRHDVIEGHTGFLFRPGDPGALADTAERYFASELFRSLPRRREEIRLYAAARYSWDAVSAKTTAVYARLGTDRPRHGGGRS